MMQEEAHALAAWKGALAAGTPVLALASLAVVMVPLLEPVCASLMSALLPASMVAPMLDGGFFLVALALALPVAALAHRQVRNAVRFGEGRGRAAAAGVGMVTALVTGGAALTQASSLMALVDSGTAMAGALLVTGMVGATAFQALPTCRSGEEEVPALYHAAASAGLGAGALLVLAGMVDAAALAFPILDLPRLVLYQALPSPLNDMASVAVILASLAPVTWLVTRGVRSLMPRAHPASIAAGLVVPLLSPAVSMLACAILFAPSALELTVVHVFMALGALLGAIPNLVAMGLALAGERYSKADRSRLEC
jgi:hypothetical protein